MDLHQLVQAKVDCLQKLKDSSDAFTNQREVWDISDLERLIAMRTQIIKKIQWLDQQVAEWMTSGLKVFQTWNELQKSALRALSEKESALATQVLSSEAKIIEVVEIRKAELLKEKWNDEKAKAVLGKFKSKSRPDSGEGLDQVL